MPDLPGSNQPPTKLPVGGSTPSPPGNQTSGGDLSGSVSLSGGKPSLSTAQPATPPWREQPTKGQVTPPVAPAPTQSEKLAQKPTPAGAPSLAKTSPVSPPPVKPESPPTAEPPPEETEVFHLEKRSPVKTILAVVLIIIFLASLAFFAFRFLKPGEKKEEGITLTYWGLWEPESVMKEILVDWQKEHPEIKINYSFQSHQEYRERLQSALARGQGPDIFRFHNTWLPMLKNELDPVPATVMNASTYSQSFYPVAGSSLRSGANYLGIPLEIDTLALFYNQDIFTAAEVSPPKTWDELRQLATQLTLRNEQGRIQRAGVALGTTGNIWHWSDILGLMMLQNGADLSNPTGSLAEDAVTFYTLFSKTDRVWDETLPNSMLAFASGKTAMYFGFSWDVFEIKNINPELNFQIVPAPQLPGTDVAWASFWVEGVSQKGENKEAAWEFLKFLSSKPVMEKLYQAEAKLRLFGEPYSRIDMASLIQSDSLMAPFISQAAKAQTWYLCSRTFDNGINDRMIKYFEDAVNAVNNGKAAKEALTTAANGVAQVLSQYGLGAYTVR